MRVGLSVDSLSPELAGIGRYCWELASRLPAHSSVESVDCYLGDERIVDPAKLLGRPQTSQFFRSRNVMRVRKWLPKRSPRIDVFHGPNYGLPDWVDGGVVTIHDLSVFRFPEMHPVERVKSFERNFGNMLSRAVQLITDSETVRAEVIEFTGLPPGRVTAIPLGIAAHFGPLAEDQRAPVLVKYGLPQTGYGLTMSSLEPRKRIDSLLDSWRLLPGALRSRFPLVIAGAAGWRNEPLREQIACAVAEGWAHWLGFIPEADLPALYSGARVFAYPSLYEGFGLPPLEAMASGVPTVVAESSCLPEVTKGAAMLVDPQDVDGFAIALSAALEDESWRRKAISAGVQVASTYTWDRCIDCTVSIYQRSLQEATSAHG